jgi:hypothetical protein
MLVMCHILLEFEEFKVRLFDFAPLNVSDPIALTEIGIGVGVGISSVPTLCALLLLTDTSSFFNDCMRVRDVSEVLRGLCDVEVDVGVKVAGGGEKVSTFRSMRLSLPLRDLAFATL